VRLRHALANSLNVPAVHVAHRLGAGHVLTVLHRFGFESLKRDAEHYGVALALGDGEVRLFELGQAYSTLSRAGLHRPLRVVRAVVPNGKARVTPAVAAPRQVLGSTTAELITDMLADPHARRAAFGADNVLELPFPAAVKTGTSKGYRDNWTVGYTREVTVAVWVGNFDGRPLRQSSGVTGAGPLFQDAMLAVMRDRVPAPLTAMTGLLSVAVCPLSGALPGLDCPHRVVEWFDGGRAPTARCAMHEQVWIDSRSGQRSAAGCTGAAASVVEAYPPEYQSWAESAGRPLAPRTAAAGCSEALAPSAIAAAEPSISFPYDGARFHVDPNLTLAQQQIVLEARAGRDARVTFVLDGQSVGTSRAPFALPWTLRPGVHRLEVRAANGARSAPVSFRVE
jgi:penicillin-binding protein 1C